MTPRRGGRTRPGGPTKARLHWDKARRFRDQATQNASGAGWDGAVSNAILAGVHLIDAFCLQHLGRRSDGGNHAEALNLLSQANTVDPEIRRRVAAHVEGLLSQKNRVQYSDSAATADDARDALRHLQRAFRAARPVAEAAGWPTRD